MTKPGASPDKATEVAPDISAEAVRAQLDRLLSSDALGKSERMKSFLRFIVSETLAGGAERLKEYPIAIEVFGRDESFDPKTSAIVRVEAGRLRHRLREYFSGPGRDDPVHIALPVGTYVPEFTDGEGETPPALPDKPSIAVLPFANLGGEPEQEFFADGMAEDLITALSRVRWLFVIARNSTFAYKGKSSDVRTVGQELSVRYVLEGSVRRGGNRVRVSAQLIDAASGSHVWADQFDREPTDLFDLQDEITQSIVATLEPELDHYERERALRKPPGNFDAWEYYQRGLWHMYRFTADENAEAQSLFRRATESDPRFSLAYAGLGYAYLLEVPFGYGRSSENSLARARAAAEQAVALDDREPMAHCTLGRVRVYSGDVPTAIRDLRTAITLNPNFALAHWGLGHAYFYAGQLDEAISQFDRFAQLSPHDPNLWLVEANKSTALSAMGEYHEALDVAEVAANRPGGGLWAHLAMAMALGHLDRRDEAGLAFAKAQTIKPDISLSFLRTSMRHTNPDQTQHLLDGLRKAGLDVPDRPAASD